jgi:hypothetical protein
VDARFEGALHQRWINTRDHLALSWRALARSAAIGAGAMVLASAGVAYADANEQVSSDYVPILLAMAAFVAVIIVLSAGGKKKRDAGSAYTGAGAYGTSGSRKDDQSAGQDSGGESGSGCSGSGCSGGGGCSS